MEENNKIQRSNKINPVATGIAGVMIGAGLTVAATALQDKKNQQKVKQVLKTAGMKAMKYVDQLKNETKEQKQKGVEKIHENVKDVKKVAQKAL